MNSDMLQGIIRAVLAAIGGILVGKGYLSADVLNDIIGALVVLATAAWSIFHKQAQADATTAKVASASIVTGTAPVLAMPTLTPIPAAPAVT